MTNSSDSALKRPRDTKGYELQVWNVRSGLRRLTIELGGRLASLFSWYRY